MKHIQIPIKTFVQFFEENTLHLASFQLVKNIAMQNMTESSLLTKVKSLVSDYKFIIILRWHIYNSFIFKKHELVPVNLKVMSISTRGEISFKFYTLDSTQFQFVG